MTDNTPQDNELREELYRLLNTDPRGDTYVIPYRVMDIIVDFITADRKRVELESKIDTLEYAKISPKFKIEEKIEQLRLEAEL